MKYRTKPMAVAAYRWDVNNEQNGPSWFRNAIKDGKVRLDWFRNCLWIATPKGPHRADPYDYVICGVKGKLYTCKPDIFEMIYEEVSE